MKVNVKKIKNQQYFEINPNEVLIFDLNTKEIVKKRASLYI